jgi:hypothetical protein
MHHGLVHVRPSRTSAVRNQLLELGPLFWIAIVVAFLVTRLPFLDADIPEWLLTRYAPIDEFGYTVPAFNLVEYGAWIHQAAPWAPIEGPPINALQNLMAAVTMWVGGDSYWGLRASSVVFGLVAFLALVAVTRRQTDEAVAHGEAARWLGSLVVIAAAVLLLVDFSSLLSGRIVEPTISRLAAAAVVVLLVSQGVFFGPDHGPRRTAAFGALATAAVLFVYIYNAFVVAAALLLVVWWAWRAGGGLAVIRHVAWFAVGGLATAACFFALYFLIYDQSPLDWARNWILSFVTTTRGNGISWTKIASIAEANLFRLDPAFLGLVMAGLPVFVWTVVRRPAAWSVFVLAGLATFVAQSAFVADYPERKFLMMILFALPIAVGAILGWRDFRAWAVADRRRTIAAFLWLAGSVALGVIATPLGRIPNTALLAPIVLVAGVSGLTALVSLVVVPRGRLPAAAAAVLALAIIVPLAFADLAYVYRRPSFTYRDAQAAAAADVNGQVTAGSLSYAMQLYNTSKPVLNSYFSGISRAEYDADVVRMFREGGAVALFGYADADVQARWVELGFRLVETYRVKLPLGHKLGRYVFEPNASADTSLGWSPESGHGVSPDTGLGG